MFWTTPSTVKKSKPLESRLFLSSILGVCEKLPGRSHFRSQEQAQLAQANEQEERKGRYPQPVPVSPKTIKQIIRLLRDTKYVGQLWTYSTLKGLFKAVEVEDIRVAITLVLISVSSNKWLQKTTFNFIEEYLVPATASVDAFRPLNETEWKKAGGRRGFIPDAYEGHPVLCLSSILKILIDSIPRARQSQDTWMKGVILPILELSTLNHRRWTASFLKHNGFALLNR